jgi:ATP-dependent Clp protease ATP-binding subunit ClpC
MDELKQTMRPELINRIDKVIIFRALTTKEAKQVLDLQLTELNVRLQEQHALRLVVTASAKNYLVSKGYNAQSGVRTLRRAIQDEIEDKIAENLLSETLKKNQTITIDVKNKKLVFVDTPIKDAAKKRKQLSKVAK